MLINDYTGLKKFPSRYTCRNIHIYAHNLHIVFFTLRVLIMLIMCHLSLAPFSSCANSCVISAYSSRLE